MNFAECPVVYIDEYYREKIGKIDLECEKAILSSNDDKEKSDLNILRLDLINNIQNFHLIPRVELLITLLMLYVHLRFFSHQNQSEVVTVAFL